MTTLSWIEQIRPTLEYVVAGTPDQYIARFLQKADVPEDQLNTYLFDAYALGREFQDQPVMESSRIFLQTRIPDLEQRLPFYEMMFDLMDKGKFRRGDGRGLERYELTEQLHQQLGRTLSQQIDGSEEQAWLYVRKFSRVLASFPGIQFTVEVNDPSLPRHVRVALISNYLHRPLKKLLTTLEERSAAAVHYDNIVLKNRSPL